MKKILLTILLCLYMTNVSALTYSDYSEFSEYTDEVIYADDLTDVKTERRYKYYKLTKELGPYEKEETINSNYPLTNYDDYTYTKESDYLIEKPEEKKGRVITSHNVYYYKKAKDTNYIEIINSNSKNIDMNISNLSIKYKDEPVDYSIETTNVTDNVIKPNGSMKLIFKEELMLKYLTISLHYDLSLDNGATLLINIKNNDLLIKQCNYNYSNKNSIDLNISLKNITVNSNATEDYYTDKYEDPTMNTKYYGKVTAYTYKDILYRKYNLKKEYYPEYLAKSIDDYIYQDSDDYKDYYAKRTRTIIPDTSPSEDNENETLDNQNSETSKEGQALDNKNNIVKKLLTTNKNITGIDKLNKPLTKNNKITNYKKPSMLLKIDNDRISDDNSLNNDYKIIKTKTDKTNYQENKTPISNYLSYILIILIFLALLLSKLYKKKK